MSVKGVRQLKNLLIRYSDLDGSSKGVREWIRTSLIPFATNNPDLQITTELKRSKHPFVRGEYLVGTTKTIGIKNLEPEEVDSYIMDLRNQIGRKVLPRKEPVVSGPTGNSIQGEWHERMALPAINEFKIEHIYNKE